jgi:16S rRNA (adenine1518-N6/adenine1519-N6)-dimethyltransferase
VQRHVPRKRFGQHFLHDPGVIRRILAALAPQPGQVIVEIGPGLGALTVPLLKQAHSLQAVELDRDVIPRLEAACAGHGQLLVHAADALRFDFRALAPPDGKLRLVGNLPYNISTPLLFHLLEQADAIADMLFMLQKEVVERMVAGPGDEAYGRLSVSLAARARVEALFNVSRGAFTPPPRVESAVVRIVPQPAPFPLDDATAFSRVVAAAFSQRRKTLANALRHMFTREDIAQQGLDPQLRAERISPAEFARLSNALARRERSRG